MLKKNIVSIGFSDLRRFKLAEYVYYFILWVNTDIGLGAVLAVLKYYLYKPSSIRRTISMSLADKIGLYRPPACVERAVEAGGDCGN